MQYDLAIIGGGIVGLATGLAITQRFPKIHIIILEKETQLAYHQTGHNSGVIHSGIYYRPGSFKAEFSKKGNQSMVNFCETYGLDYEICGKVIIATDEKQLTRLENLYQRGLQNGLSVKKLSKEQVKEKEPYVNCLVGIEVPTTGITSYQQVCQKYAELIQVNRGEICLNTRVTGIVKNNQGYTLETNQNPVSTKFLINCGGLQSDRIANLDGVNPDVKIIPFRGEYYELKADKRYLVKNLIYPVPNPNFPFLGVHFTRMIDGSIHAGPNAVLGLKREAYQKTDFNWQDFQEIITYPGLWKLAKKHWDEGLQEMIRSFSKAAFVHSLQQLIPEVTANDLIPSAAGVRAQALKIDGELVDDFLIIETENALHVCNAPSPAATASLEIGKAISSKIPDSFF